MIEFGIIEDQSSESGSGSESKVTIAQLNVLILSVSFQQIEGAQIAVFNYPLQKFCKKNFQEYIEEYSGSDEEYEEYPDLLLKEGHCKGQFICLRHCTV